MPLYVLIFLRVLSFLVGFSIVFYVLISVIRTFVLPRSAPDKLVRLVFLVMRKIFDLRISIEQEYERRDEIMALYAPFTLVILPAVWLVCVLAGYMAMFWATTGQPLYALYKISGSSLFTLGYAVADDFVTTSLIFTESAIGLFLVALLIAYLPTMYAAFSKREAAVTMLEVRAGSPPSALEMISRFDRLNRLDKLGELWVTWELWFVDIDESHTSLAALSFFRSPQSSRSWITAAGTVLDAAALVSVEDFANRAPRPMNNGERLSIGKHQMTWIDAPHLPHGWETGYLFEEKTRTLFAGANDGLYQSRDGGQLR